MSYMIVAWISGSIGFVIGMCVHGLLGMNKETDHEVQKSEKMEV